MELSETPSKNARREAFDRLDKTMLRPLPIWPWRYRRIEKAKLDIDYHVEYELRHSRHCISR
jgi:hypothetical protein